MPHENQKFITVIIEKNKTVTEIISPTFPSAATKLTASSSTYFPKLVQAHHHTAQAGRHLPLQGNTDDSGVTREYVKGGRESGGLMNV